MKVEISKLPDGNITISEYVEFGIAENPAMVNINAYESTINEIEINAAQVKLLITELTALYHKMRK